MTRKNYKATRPDPAKLLAEVRGLVAELHAWELDIHQCIKANQEMNERILKIQEPLRQERDEREQQLVTAKDEYNKVRERMADKQFQALTLIIEDMSE